MSKRTIRGLGHASILFLGCAAFTGLHLAEAEAATTYTITTTSMAISNNNNCTLPEALKAVATARAVDKCAAGSGSAAQPDVIKLVGGTTYQIPGTLTITSSVIIQSATANSMAILAQNGPPSDVDNGGVIVIGLTPAANVLFQDIDLKGSNSGVAIGIVIAGNETSDNVTLTRCWVENFDLNGIFDQDSSLTLIDSAVDGNGSKGTGGFGNGSGIFIESQGNVTSTRLALTNSSVTNNLQGGIETELGTGSVSTITGSTIADNHGGNGLYVVGGHGGSHVNIFGSSIVANTADNLNQPFSGPGSGGGVYNFDNIITIDQTVIDLNAGAGGAIGEPEWEHEFDGALSSMKNSLVGDTLYMTIGTSLGSNLLNVDAGLDHVLRDNGGVGQRHPKTHKPLHGSQLIDFSATSDSAVGAQDQRHKNRGFDFITGGNKFDIGAVELQTGE